jgi:small-conductance mechanosensitive channel
MAKIEREKAEILIGALLLTFSFLISLFMVIDILEKSIILSIFALSSSFAGLAIGFHGIYGLILLRRRERE